MVANINLFNRWPIFIFFCYLFIYLLNMDKICWPIFWDYLEKLSKQQIRQFRSLETIAAKCQIVASLISAKFSRASKFSYCTVKGPI